MLKLAGGMAAPPRRRVFFPLVEEGGRLVSPVLDRGRLQNSIFESSREKACRRAGLRDDVGEIDEHSAVLSHENARLQPGQFFEGVSTQTQIAGKLETGFHRRRDLHAANLDHGFSHFVRQHFQGILCQVLPGGELLPKHIPSFARVWHGKLAAGFPLEQGLATARAAMERRGKTLTDAQESLLQHVFKATSDERDAAFHRQAARRAVMA